ncbi:ABC transporter substrate-binding protein [Lachnoclostridium sp. Marseille-P6806]|uniref:ABC transporter substrate-binding protein n=1 Tax=Lachnoclostridium sp. Marseille-P6806 TaxID=2364793 RepID=UPI00103178D2|nr:sugar ABC transporter substrate-binding protein [Lachnoclostridium sp. Marseille-P6806]
MKRNSFLTVLLIGSLSLGLLAGCGSAPSQDAGMRNQAGTEGADRARSDPGDIVELTFTGWEASPLETEAVEKGIKIFEEQNPDIKVSYTPGLSGAEYTAKLLSAASAGSLPDIMFMQSTDYRAFASKGILLDVTDRFSGEFSLDDFIDSSREIMDFDGKVYGVSSCSVMPIIYYNKDLFDAAGVDYPKSDPSNCWTMDAFREVAKKLTSDDVYGCYGFEVDGMWPALVNENNGHYYDPADKATPQFDTTENKEVFQAIMDIRSVDGSAPDATTLSNVGMTALQMFETGKIAMLCDGSWSLQELAATDLNIGMAPLPSFKKASSSGQAHLHCINAKTEHPEEAWKFVKFLSGEEYQTEMISTGLWMPNRKSWYTEDGLKIWYRKDVHGDDYMNMLRYFEDAQADERPFTLTTETTDAITEEMQLFFSGDKSLNDAMSSAQSRMMDAYRASIQ